MKKNLFAVLFMAVCLATAPAMAASFNIGANSFAPGADIGFAAIPNGGAFGGGIGVGAATADADGFVLFGGTSGNVSTGATGLVDHNDGRFNPHMGDRSIGVYSETAAAGAASAHIDVHVNGFLGAADADAAGFAAQGTMDVSGLSESPRYFDSNGNTAGIATQSAFGGFGMNAGAGVIIGSAGAGAGASVNLEGSSYSRSYRAVDWNSTGKTEVMGTNVGAQTFATINGGGGGGGNGLATGGAGVVGGFVAGGNVASMTTQNLDGGTANAVATGSYSGGRPLNGTYAGSATGYTQTSATHVWGTNGSVMTSNAGMSVTSY
jgi:hypothetical protein